MLKTRPKIADEMRVPLLADEFPSVPTHDVVIDFSEERKISTTVPAKLAAVRPVQSGAEIVGAAQVAALNVPVRQKKFAGSALTASARDIENQLVSRGLMFGTEQAVSPEPSKLGKRLAAELSQCRKDRRKAVAAAPCMLIWIPKAAKKAVSERQIFGLAALSTLGWVLVPMSSATMGIVAAGPLLQEGAVATVKGIHDLFAGTSAPVAESATTKEILKEAWSQSADEVLGKFFTP